MNFELNSTQISQNSKELNKEEELSKLAELSKEEIIQKSNNSNEINSKKKSLNFNEAKNLEFKYGKIKILKYDKNGDPSLVIGPNYLSFFLVLFLKSVFYV